MMHDAETYKEATGLEIEDEVAAVIANIEAGAEAWLGSGRYSPPETSEEKAEQFIDYWNGWVETHVRPHDAKLADRFQALPTDVPVRKAMKARADLLREFL